ncbi:4-phosphoerythronate dehydrogenase [Shewanella sp. OMA3-2]|uniref:4-phosphoerythronate dehydrogenase n=1 Tax=Shewanella sp. OMA3-2 TaxID=2908650 RepID=UPI001F23D9BC|nr:4-phosphoerythronate dehydrogenase [Shewanella sp. OMA3-2]UJF23266.1 4-phosphoerythronate dehydrogenase [Shewanella sp. OMA3-2]
MKIIADENMPFVEALFADLGQIEFVNGRTLTAKQVKDADVLLVRSVTKVNQALLQHAHKLKFVGSATIGTDHIDIEYLQQRGIMFSSAPGCNATAVGEFVFIALLELAKRLQTSLKGKVVGIVGAGNTGSAAAKCFEAYGLQVLLCDPIKQAEGDSRQFTSLDELLERADIVSLHVPITKMGPHKTWYLFDEKRLKSLKTNLWLINCCRGEVIDNQALIKIKQTRTDLKVILDVWEGEPNPMAELVPLVEFATPHIAGYSLEGKARGTHMLYQQLCQYLNIAANQSLNYLLPKFEFSQLLNATDLDETSLLKMCRLVFDLRDDDALFRQHFGSASGFDLLRKQHTHRREFSALSVKYPVNDANSASTDCKNTLSSLGFSQ